MNVDKSFRKYITENKLYHLFFHRNRHRHYSNPLQNRKHSRNENQGEFLNLSCFISLYTQVLNSWRLHTRPSSLNIFVSEPGIVATIVITSEIRVFILSLLLADEIYRVRISGCSTMVNSSYNFWPNRPRGSYVEMRGYTVIRRLRGNIKRVLLSLIFVQNRKG